MQETIVALIVLCAAGVVLKRYAPTSLKRAARALGVRTAIKLGWHGLAARIAERAQAGASCGNGCESCGACGSDPANSVEKHTISPAALKQTISR